MLTCFNVQKTHYFSNTVHYCRSSMPRLSQTLRFLQSPSFRQAQSALIGQLAQCIVIGRTPQALVANVTPLSIIASFSFQNKCKDKLIMSLVLPSVQAREGNRVAWHTQWWCSYAGAPLRILGPLDSIFTRALLRSGGGGGISIDIVYL